MFQRTLAACIVAATLVTAGCASQAAQVTVLASDLALLVPGSTYVWAPKPAGVTMDPRLANDVMNQRLRAAVDQALAAKGYRQVSDPAGAALQVAYFAVLQDQQVMAVDRWGGSSGPGCGLRGCIDGWGMYGPPMGNVSSINYTQGSLIVNITDLKTGRLAWSATSQKRVDHADATQAGLNSIVTELIRDLPGAQAPR